MEKYYVLETFASMKAMIISLLDSMQTKRTDIAKYQDKKNILKAKNIYTELEGLKTKLLDALMNLKLLFCEADICTHCAMIFSFA